MIIYLYGPDGSGKTTLSRLLANELVSRGFSVRLFWMRGTHTLASVLARILRRFSSFRGFENPFYSIRIPDSLRPLWTYIELVSIAPIVAKYLIASSMSIVVSDRFLPDLVVWISITSRNPSFISSPLARFLLRVSREVGCGIYVTASIDSLYSRRSDMPCRFIGVEKRIYDEIAKYLSTPTIDTSSMSIDESFNELLKHVKRCLGGGM